MDAVRQRDEISTAALRSALAAIANAEAVVAADGPRALPGPIAKSVPGLGAADAPRRELSEADIAAVIRREVSDREAAAHTYEAVGRPDAASRLHMEVAVLRSYLNDR